MSCFVDYKDKKKGNMNEYFPEPLDVDPLLICNQGRKQHIGKNNPDIKECYINRDYNDTLYARNQPSKSLPVNVDIRPISTTAACFNEKILEIEPYISNLEKLPYKKVKRNLNTIELLIDQLISVLYPK